MNSNDEILDTGPVFNRSKLPKDETVLLRLIPENNFNKFFLKLKPSKSFLTVNYYLTDLLTTTTSTTTIRSPTKHSIRIQVLSNPCIIRLQCITGKFNFNWIKN